MFSPDALDAIAPLLEIAFVGRILLSLLPPGLPGRHGPADLAATWAASHVLGTVAIGVQTRLLGLLDAHPPHAALLVPWLLLALARWLTLPGAMVPRHEPLPEVSGPAPRVLSLVALLAVVAGAVRGFDELDPAAALSIAHSLALLALCHFALSAARRASLAKSLCILALALALAAALASAPTSALPLALSTGAGAAFMAPWLRRGDRRAAAIAAIAFAGSALLGPREGLFGLAGLFALWLHTPAPSQRPLALFSAALLLPCAALGWRSADRLDPDLSRGTLAVGLVVALALATRKRLADARDRRRQSAEPPTLARLLIDTARPQAEAVRDAVLLMLFLIAARGELSAVSSLPAALLPLAPMIAVECGLLFAPAEQPFPANPSPERSLETAPENLRR